MKTPLGVVTAEGDTQKPFRLLRYACAPEIRQYIKSEIDKCWEPGRLGGPRLKSPKVRNQARKEALEDVMRFMREGEVR